MQYISVYPEGGHALSTGDTPCPLLGTASCLWGPASFQTESSEGIHGRQDDRVIKQGCAILELLEVALDTGRVNVMVCKLESEELQTLVYKEP